MNWRSNVLAFLGWMWHKTAVPVWLERFALVILASAFAGIVIFNTMKVDTTQKVGLGMAILGLSIFIAQTVHLQNVAKSTPQPQPMPTSQPSKSATPPQGEAPEKNLPKDPLLTSATSKQLVPFTVQHLDSGDAKYPDEMRVTLQPRASIQPVHLVVRCKGDIGQIHYGFVLPGGLIGVLDGINPRPKEYEFSFTNPPMTPDNPLVIRILSRERNEVIEIERF